MVCVILIPVFNGDSYPITSWQIAGGYLFTLQAKFNIVTFPLSVRLDVLLVRIVG